MKKLLFLTLLMLSVVGARAQQPSFIEFFGNYAVREGFTSVELGRRMMQMMTRQAADIAQRMSGFESRVLLKRQNMTVNAKSRMGVLSAELRDGQAVTILAEGPDEAQAVCTLSKMLGA